MYQLGRGAKRQVPTPLSAFYPLRTFGGGEQSCAVYQTKAFCVLGELPTYGVTGGTHESDNADLSVRALCRPHGCGSRSTGGHQRGEANLPDAADDRLTDACP